MKKFFNLLLVGLLACSLVIGGCGQSKEKEAATSEKKEEAKAKLKVAILLPGNINDKGWNASAYQGLMDAEKEYGIEVAYQETVAQSDQEEVFRNFATNGYNLIIGHGYQFADVATKVATQFPDVKFVILNGSAFNGKNLASYSFTNWQPGYLTGALAGLLTKTNQLGCIGGQDIPVIVSSLEGFKAGAMAVNPKVKVNITYVGTWDDVAKGKETALAMYNNGADIVVTDANAVGLGSIEAAKQVNKYAIGFVDDQFDVDPAHVVASGIQSNQAMVKYVIKTTMDGQFNPAQNVLGVKEKVEGIALRDWENKLDKEIVAKIKGIEQDIIDGKITLNK